MTNIYTTRIHFMYDAVAAWKYFGWRSWPSTFLITDIPFSMTGVSIDKPAKVHRIFLYVRFWRPAEVNQNLPGMWMFRAHIVCTEIQWLKFKLRYIYIYFISVLTYIGTDSRLAPSQWETSLHCNAVSHQLGGNLESALLIISIIAPSSSFT